MSRDEERAYDAALRLQHRINWQPTYQETVVVVWIVEERSPDLLGDRPPFVVRRGPKHAGRRILHLLYPWALFEAAVKGKKADLNDLVDDLAKPGEVLRASIRYARREREKRDARTGIY